MLDLHEGQAFPYGQGGRAVANEARPIDDAPRVLIALDAAFRTWLSKAVRKIKASGPDGYLNTSLSSALLMEDKAVAFIAGMVERIVNADVGKEELTSLSTLLLVLIPKADWGARPVAIANTIVRLHGKSVRPPPRRRGFHENLRGGQATCNTGRQPLHGPERIIHTVKAAGLQCRQGEHSSVGIRHIERVYRKKQSKDAKHPILPARA